MNLDELRTVQSKERSKDSLQHLRESFYSDVADYVADLRERRDRAAENADNPFDDPEVNRLTDEIHTAEEVVEAIYERRVGKVVKRASLAAAGMPADEEGLTSEEQELFGELVERIETNKEAVLDVLAGEDAGGLDMSGDTPTESSATASRTTASEPSNSSESGDAPASSGGAGGSPAEDVSAADVMGGDPSSGTASATAEEGAGDDSSRGDSGGSRPATAEAAATAATSGESETPGVADSGCRSDSTTGEDATAAESDADSDPLAGLADRTTIRLTSDVGEIFGVDERTYDLASEDVVTLPEANAEPLVERGAAEKLD